MCVFVYIYIYTLVTSIAHYIILYYILLYYLIHKSG